MKVRNILRVIKARGNLFFNRISRVIVLIVFLSLLLVFLISYKNSVQGNQVSSLSCDERLAQYLTRKESNEQILKMYSGQIPLDTPLSPDPDLYIRQLKEEVALYNFYIKTHTCEDDYIQVQQYSEMLGIALKGQEIGIALLDISFIFGFILLAMSILSGFAVFNEEMSGKRNKLWFQATVNKKEICLGKILFVRLIFVFLFLLFLVVGAVISRNFNIHALIQSGTEINTISIFGIYCIRLFFSYLVSIVFFYGISVLRLSTKNLYVSASIALLIIGFLFILSAIIHSGDYPQNIPFIGLLYNKSGFFDIAVVWQIPLVIIFSALFAITAVKKYKRIEC